MNQRIDWGKVCINIGIVELRDAMRLSGYRPATAAGDVPFEESVLDDHFRLAIATDSTARPARSIARDECHATADGILQGPLTLLSSFVQPTSGRDPCRRVQIYKSDDTIVSAALPACTSSLVPFESAFRPCQRPHILS